MKERVIETKIRELPEDLQQEVLDYADYLLSKYQKKKSKKEKFKFDWEGGLSEIGKKYTSVELQHKALKYR